LVAGGQRVFINDLFVHSSFNRRLSACSIWV